ncbi:S-adenosyl-L-methionine-dependent methyltransferase [Mycena vulgaris]|nr:S-adenosyl-L-methionine-dependent methyltransferase [Mycena vulgaris]
MTRLVPYVSVPAAVPPLSSRKRKQSRSPSPSDSDSSRAPSPSLSPRKKTRTAEDVDVTTSRLSRIVFDPVSVRPSRSRLSPTVSELALLSDNEDGAGEDGEDLSSDVEMDSAASTDVVFQFEEDLVYVEEKELSKQLDETPGQGIPIRRLLDFTLFKRDGLQLINPLQLLGISASERAEYGASGLVLSVNDEDGDDDSEDENSEDDENRVKLLKIIEFSLHNFSPADDDSESDYSEGDLDEKIYIMTAGAWYILDTPSSVYQPFWTPFQLLHRFAHRILTESLENPTITYDDFLESLRLHEDPKDDAEDDLTESAFKSDEVVAYIIQTLLDCNVPIMEVPLIRSLVEQPLPVLPPFKQRSKRALNQDSETFLMPTIGRIVLKHLISPVSVVGAELDQVNDNLVTELEDIQEHHEDPESMHWVEGLDDHAGYYSSVIMDGVTYQVGDVVAVAPGTDGDWEREEHEKVAASHCVNAYANKVWFIRIIYFFDTKRRGGEKMFHGQWFLHGSRSVVQEYTHTQELLLLHECDDVAVATIYQKCPVRFLELGEGEEPDKLDPQVRDYFCRFMYDEVSYRCTDLPTDDECRRLDALFPAHRHCVTCGRKAEEELSRTVQVVGDERCGYGLAQFGRAYHVGDFAYVKPDVRGKEGVVLFVAQITHVDHREQTLRVRYYKRDVNDERRIYQTRRRNDVAAHDLDGLCFVRFLDADDDAQQDEIERWVESHPDHFFTNEKETVDGIGTVMPEDFNWCSTCFDKHCDDLEARQRFVRRFGQVALLELFAGAGGLSQGLCQSGFFTTDCAVELSESAAETFRRNHPESKVLCADVNEFLRYVVDRRDGKCPPPLRSTNKNRSQIPDDHVPHPGEIKILCGGPPCQSFSGANAHKTEDDSRSALPFAMLSVAELYEPDIVLLENVVGLLQYAVSNQAGNGTRVEKAMLKLIYRGLMALNYKPAFKTLQAGQYGAPQDRQRLIFLGTKRGCADPEYPIPTHAFYKPAQKHLLFSKNNFIPPVKRGRGPDDDHIFAPHASVSVQDAIGDFPAYDWSNPHEIARETAADIAEVKARVTQGIRQFDASDAPVGFRDPVAYATPPTNRYQKDMRRKQPTLVENHVTDNASPRVAELSTQIPLIPLANHKHLPAKFFTTGSKLKVNDKMCYGRLDANGHFKTAMTTVQPRSRGSYVLHPTQKRSISVAEAKRCQGFADDYILCRKQTPSARVKDFYKHIGNAVPVPLAAALGRSLEAAAISTWKKRPREGSPVMD